MKGWYKESSRQYMLSKLYYQSNVDNWWVSRWENLCIREFFFLFFLFWVGGWVCVCKIMLSHFNSRVNLVLHPKKRKKRTQLSILYMYHKVWISHYTNPNGINRRWYQSDIDWHSITIMCKTVLPKESWRSLQYAQQISTRQIIQVVDIVHSLSWQGLYFAYKCKCGL